MARQPTTPDAVAPDKQAVLVIHGMGEQRPMATLRGFVEAVWTRNPGVHHPHGVATLWSKPDTVSGNLELRRLSSGANRTGLRTDFFEFYWAHMMRGTTLSQVLAWLKLLLVRPPWKVPPPLRGAWCVLLLLSLAIATLVIVAAAEPEGLGLPRWFGVVGGAALSWVLQKVVQDVIGDAARYLDAAPDNVASRQAIRARGVEILERLHQSGEYQRIVVVGHSLGSVIGYDVLTHAWPRFNRHPDAGRGAMPALDRLEQLARMAPRSATAPTASVGHTASAEATASWQSAWREGQGALRAEQARRGSRWLVTDFVSCGSPLAHAALLLADDLPDLRRKQEERELPTCPPTLEPPADLFSYPADNRARTLHHAAVFGPTRWTNLYFPARRLIQGDLLGGPVAPTFGPGVRDVPVSTSQLGGFFSHTRYWSPDSPDAVGAHVEALQQALDLAETIPIVDEPGVRTAEVDLDETAADPPATARERRKEGSEEAPAGAHADALDDPRVTTPKKPAPPRRKKAAPAVPKKGPTGGAV